MSWTVVHARSECEDLQYMYDAVSRLGEAQTLGAVRENITIKEHLDPLKYLSPGILWWAFDWDSASEQNNRCFHKGKRPSTQQGWKPEHGCIVLIDEIDKADADLPNGLLEILGNGRFTVPFQADREAIGLSATIPPPLVVITTNEERELPAAFVRRCLVLYLELPVEKKDLIPWLIHRGQVHFRDICTEKVMHKAAEQLYQDRYEALKSGLPAPGQAEYLDMLRAVSRIETKEKDQLKVLDAIGEFALKKNPKDIYS
jgi:MoxR-like ATPase